jgi:hypothetical protein
MDPMLFIVPRKSDNLHCSGPFRAVPRFLLSALRRYVLAYGIPHTVTRFVSEEHSRMWKVAKLFGPALLAVGSNADLDNRRGRLSLEW